MSDKKVTLSILTYYDERLKEWVLEQIGDSSTNVFNLKGSVATINELPITNNKAGDVYLVGPLEDGSYNEYVWLETKWEFLGTTQQEVENKNLYEGENGTGTPSEPAEGTILAQLKDSIEASSDLEII